MLVYGGMLLALTDPPLALAVVTILAIWLLYRSVTNLSMRQAPA